jgi:hypothetical protein
MTSRERVMTAMAHQEPDHVPLALNPHDNPPVPEAFRGEYAWADYWLSRGADAWLNVHVPWRLREGTVLRTWEEQPPGERYPVVFGEYETPKGRLRHAVRKAPGWPYGEGEIELLSDFNPPRAVEHPVKAEQDLEALEYLMDVPDGGMLERLRSQARKVRRDADERGVIVEGHCTTGGDSMAWLCGFDHMVYLAVDQPELIRRLLGIIHRNDMRRLEMMLDMGVVDIVVRRAWYESLRSVNPRIYREFLAPLIREEAALAQQAGAPYMYICTADTMGLVPIWKEIGVDIVWGVDPVQGDADLARLKAEAGEWLCFWGGMNAWVTLQRGSDAEIREAVETAVSTLGPGGGFVLLPVDAIGPDVTPHALDVLVDAWKACGRYPLGR